MKKNKYPVIYSAVLFAASFVYLVVYQLKLKNVITPTYSLIKSLAASPIFYFSMAFIVAALVLAWAKKPVSKKTKRLCIIGCAALETAFVIVILLIFVAKVGVPSPIIWFIIPHPWIHIVPGALLSIGAFKD